MIEAVGYRYPNASLNAVDYNYGRPEILYDTDVRSLHPRQIFQQFLASHDVFNDVLPHTR
jgi:hypothetical protein